MPTLFPYPGLRPFHQDEIDIFFGREEQTDELLRKLSKTRFLGVVGPSGCGKSSLVKAGMIPALETGFMVKAGTRWGISVMRPGSHPIKRLVDALMRNPVVGTEWAGEHTASFLEATLRRGPLGLIEALRETPLPQDTNLLVVVDQFEELFRFRNDENRDVQDAFVALLLETVRQQDIPVYVVITMRSDYLGDCVLFPGLPEALNASQYLTPRMTRDQRKAAIVGPARVFGGEIEPLLVNRLLNETGTDPNQLPVLQHLLMRMWACTEPVKTVSSEVTFMEQVPSERMGHVLTVSDYEKVGGLAGALSKHADEAFGSLNDEQKRIAEILFRSLCERGEGSRDGRHPTAVSKIAARARVVEWEDVKQVVEVFRDSAYGFIVPAPPEPIYETTVLDISHESLIRQWQRLNKWVEQEAKSVETYQFLEHTARRWKDGKAALWGTPNIEIAQLWEKNEQPSPAWAERYGSNFKLAMEFLEASEEEQSRQQVSAHEEDLRKLRKARLLAVSLGIVAIILGSGILLHRYLKVWDHVSYFNDFIKIHGEPSGVGELTLEQVQRRPISIKIIRKGRWGHVHRMEAVNSQLKKTVSHNIRTYLETSEERIPDAVAWEFDYDALEHVSYETVFDMKENRIWGFIYSSPRYGQNDVRSGYFVDPNGYPRQDKKYASSFVETEHKETAKGFDEYRRYRNRGNQAIRGPDKAFGQVRRFDKDGRWIELTSLGPDDQPMNDEAGNATWSVTRIDALGNVLEQVALDASGKITIIRDGYSITKSKYDDNGNIAEESYFDLAGEPTLHVKGYHKIKWERDKQGNYIKEIYLDKADKPTIGDRGCYSMVWEYDDQNNLDKERCIGSDQKLTTNKRGFAVWRGKYDSQKLVEESFYDSADLSIQSTDGYTRARYRYNDSGKIVETAYFGDDDLPTSCLEGYARITREYDNHGHLISGAYFGIKGESIASDQGYARFDQEFDNHGNVVRVRYYGPDGERIISINGYAGWSAKYDASGNKIETMYLNAMDKPILGKEGYAGWRSEYDKTGNERQRTYVGLRGEQTLSSDGVVGYKSEYNSLGYETERKYFGLDEKQVTHREGYSSWIASYNACGKVLEQRYLNINGKPALVPWQGAGVNKSPGYSSWKQKFNPQGLPIEKVFFGINDELVLTKDGWARTVHKYDSRGNKVESSYFGVFGEQVLIEGGYHSVKRSYNAQGKVTEIKYFYVDGSLGASKEGFAHLIRQYDSLGRLIEQLFYDAENKPTYIKNGRFHKEVSRYDKRGYLIENTYFGSDSAILHKDGYHAIRYKYNNHGKEIERSYLGLNEEFVNNKYEGYAIVRMKYDTFGNQVEVTYFDADEKRTSSYNGFSRTKVTYNTRSKITDRFWFDKNDELVAPDKFGYAGTRIQYNTQGKIAYQVYLNTKKEPVIIPRQRDNKQWGYASYRVKYDGNQTETAFFDRNDTPIMINNGFHKIIQIFNSRRQMLEEKTFDVDSHSVMNALKYARISRKYNKRGYLIEVNSFDEKDLLSEAYYGYARMSMKYNSRDNMTEEAYFGADGKLKVLPKIGCALQTYKYDADGNIVEYACFGDKNTLYDEKLGYAYIVRKFDSRRRIVEERYFGPDSKPAGIQRGLHIMRFVYDHAGNKIEERYFGKNEEPVEGISPDYEYCIRWTAKYDLAKKQIETKCHRSDKKKGNKQ